MGHDHHHHHHVDTGNERSLVWAVIANMLLTAGQVIGGLVAGSLSLIADALHNFSDAASLLIAWFALRIGRRPANEHKTFGYKRAETIAALINLTTLVLLGLYLMVEAVQRLYNPAPVGGGLMMAVAALALVVDLFTTFVTMKGAKHSMNMRAAFLHNLTDALASVGVIVAGLLIMAFGWYWVDAALTFLIAGYVLYHGAVELPKVIHVLMDGAPEDVDINQVIDHMQKDADVEDVHHVHLWRIDEHRTAMEAHVVMCNAPDIDLLKGRLKAMLAESFDIHHSTLEFEVVHCGHGETGSEKDHAHQH